uniref:Uncharacterized protein n=1 Tax=Oryzias latipes TaxID=8090 RepID=A0A3B3H6I9_ORYLA
MTLSSIAVQGTSAERTPLNISSSCSTKLFPSGYPMRCPNGCPISCPNGCPIGCPISFPMSYPISCPINCPISFPIGYPMSCPSGYLTKVSPSMVQWTTSGKCLVCSLNEPRQDFFKIQCHLCDTNTPSRNLSKKS